MSLTDAQCRNAKPGPSPSKISDGGGLFLLVQPTGGRLWRLAYRFGGKQKSLALGIYPQVSLLEARVKRDDAKRVLAAGADPGVKQRLDKLARQAVAANTFALLADEFIAKQTREGRSERTIEKTTWLLGIARPMLGQRPIAEITAAEILTVLRKVEVRGRLESARRLRGTIGCVFRYAIATARAENDPTLALRGALTSPTVTPRAAITERQAFGALLRAIDSFDGQPTTRAALKLMAFLFPRPGELRVAEWSEFDLQAAIWTVPESRMKMRRPHRVPLPAQAIAVLKELHRVTGAGRLVFPSIRTVLRPISENTLNGALRRLGYSQDEATAHGFRATASTFLNECGRWNPDAIERALAHVESNSVRRAYARGEHWDERVKMMAWWAEYLDVLREGGEVVTFVRAEQNAAKANR
ncbi:MAG TPA: integrase arm-type DNA-binding domain-containing protein [Rhodopseudomonas sp.]|uniref:tyrosine-type recombinase/integrase n=1 Tax=Rhodopseudomonas sp. TaxID=1078 RepID=UPI002ED874FE